MNLLISCETLAMGLAIVVQEGSAEASLEPNNTDAFSAVTQRTKRLVKRLGKRLPLRVYESRSWAWEDSSRLRRMSLSIAHCPKYPSNVPKYRKISAKFR